MAGPLLLHLALLIFFPFSSQAAQVYWSSPTAGTVFGPGDTLIASWTVNSTSSKVSKNSTAVFRLCETDFQGSQSGSTTSCGESVTPLIQQNAGSYIASLQVAVLKSTPLLAFYDANRSILSIFSAVPNVADRVGVYLEMNDASGLESISPNFLFSPAPGLLNATLSNDNTRAGLPDIDANRVPVPVAALAIPLSLVGVILFCSIFLCCHHHRKLKEERAHDLKRLALAREKLGYGVKQASPRSSGAHVIYLDSRPTSPGRKRSFKEPVKRGYSYYQDVYTPVYYSRTRSSDSTPPESPRYHYQQRPPHLSSRSHSRREGEPRQYTREPFYRDMERTPAEPLERGPSQDYFQLPYGYQYTSRPRRDPRNVPAGLFRSVRSPVMQERPDENQQHRNAYPVPPGLGQSQHQSYRSEPRSERGRRDERPTIRISRATTADTLPTRRHLTPPTPPERPSGSVSAGHCRSEPSMREREREEEDAYVNDKVITNYFALSPNPNHSPAAAVPACLSPRVPAPPDRLHVRREARLWDFEKPLPTAPRRGYAHAADEDPVYQAVADALGRR